MTDTTATVEQLEAEIAAMRQRMWESLTPAQQAKVRRRWAAQDRQRERHLRAAAARGEADAIDELRRIEAAKPKPQIICLTVGTPEWEAYEAERKARRRRTRPERCGQEHVSIDRRAAEDHAGAWWPRLSGESRLEHFRVTRDQS